MICKTLSILNHNWSEKKSLDWGSVEMPWLQNAISNEGIRPNVYPKEEAIHIFQVLFIV
jgi:hypothetical protein